METFSIEYALLSVQSALLNVVTPELRAVVVDVCKENTLLYIRFYYDGKCSEELIDLWQCSITEASADFGPDTVLDDGVERLDYPKPIPCRGRCAYRRKETDVWDIYPNANSSACLGIEVYSVAYALLEVQKALLDVITAELRAVVVDVCKEERLLYIHIYYDGEVSKDLIDLWQYAIVKASADFGPDCVLDVGIERLDGSQKFPFRGRLAYWSKELRIFS